MQRPVFYAVSFLVAASVTAASSLAATQYVALQNGHSTVLHVPDMRRVAVGDVACIGVVAVGTGQLIVNGKQACRSSLMIWSSDGSKVSYEVVVTDRELDDVTASLRSAIKLPDVQVVNFGHGVIVRGSVQDMAEYVQLQDLITNFQGFAKENHYTIVNGVTISHSLQSIQHDFAGVAGVNELQIEPDGKGNVIVSGDVPDTLSEERVLQRARTLAGPYLAAEGKVVDRLSVAQQSEIDVKVQVLEIDETGLSQLGVRLQGYYPDPNNPRNIVYTQPSFPINENPLPSNNVGHAFNIGSFFRSVFLAPTIDAIIQSGHARVLSEPNITALPGVQATFLVGGSIPYVYSTQLGTVNVAFRDYGVQVNMTPALLPTGSIDTKINPEISDLDYQNAVTLNGFFFPALKTSRISTELVTKPGQSIVMGGLLRRLDQKDIEKVPLLSSLPILGKLFQSVRYQSSQTDVVFVMTPRVVNQ